MRAIRKRHLISVFDWCLTLKYSALLIIHISPCGRSFLAFISCLRHVLFLSLQILDSARHPHFIPHHLKCLDYSLSCLHLSFILHFTGKFECFMRLKGLCEGRQSAQTLLVFSQIGSSSIYHCCLSAAPNVKSTWAGERGRVYLSVWLFTHIHPTSQTTSGLVQLPQEKSRAANPELFLPRAECSRSPQFPWPCMPYYLPYMVFINNTSQCYTGLGGITLTLIEVWTPL